MHQLNTQQKIDFCDHGIYYYTHFDYKSKRRFVPQPLCILLEDFLMMNDIYDADQNNGMKDIFSELYSHKPSHNCVFWFKLDAEGCNSRIEILKQVKEELNATVNA